MAAIAGMLVSGVGSQVLHYMFEGNSLGPSDQPDLGHFLGWQSLDLATHMNPLVAKMAQAEFNFDGDRWAPDMGRLIAPAEEGKPLAASVKDMYDMATGEDVNRDKLWGDLAGGPASVMGVPGAEGLAITGKFIDALDWDSGQAPSNDWGNSTAPAYRKIAQGLTTGRIPQQ